MPVQETMMDNASAVTDTKTLRGEDSDGKKSMSCFHLFELLSFQSTVLPVFAVLTFFCPDSKTALTECFPMHAVWLNLFCLNYEMRVRAPEEGHHKLSVPDYFKE